jgi:hypothetical protein
VGLAEPFLLALIILDVGRAAHRVGLELDQAARGRRAAYVRSYTTTRRVETRSTVDALAGVRQKVAEANFKPGEAALPAAAAGRRGAGVRGRPEAQPKMKFEAKGGAAVEGDITNVVGGATTSRSRPPRRRSSPRACPLRRRRRRTPRRPDGRQAARPTADQGQGAGGVMDVRPRSDQGALP